MKRNQYGFAFGGPLRRDKTFFFSSFEGSNERTARTFVQTIPTARMRQGDFSERSTPIFDPATTSPDPLNPGRFTRERFSGNMIPASRLSSVAQFFMAQDVYPLPNAPGLISNFITNGPTKADSYTWSLRGDHKLTERDQLSGRFSWYKAETNFPGGLEPSPLGKRTLLNPAKNLVLSWIHTFSPNLLLEVRSNVNRHRPIYTSPIVGIEDFTEKSGIQGLRGISSAYPGYPLFSFTGYAAFNGLTFVPNERTDTGFNHIANLSWIRGRHTMKFGTEIRRFNYTLILAGAPRGNWSFDGRYTNNPSAPTGTGISFADFMLDLPFRGSRYRATDRFYYTLPDYHFYAQDDFKIKPNLTISYGIRYDLILPIRTPHLTMSGFRGDLTSPRGLPGALLMSSRKAIEGSRQTIVPLLYSAYQDLIVFADEIPGYPKWLVDPNWKTLAPRFGFSWKPLAGRPFVVRGGYGIFNELFNGNKAASSATVPFLANEVALNDSPVPTRVLRQFFGGPSFDPFPTLAGHTRYMPIPYEQHISFGFQYQFAPTLMADANYVANLARHVEGAQERANTPLPGPGAIQSRRPFPQFAQIFPSQSVNTSNYHSMQIKVEKRYSQGWTFLTAYTLSKHTGNMSTGTFDPHNLKLDYGLSDFDITHNFTTSLNYQLPIPAMDNRLVRTAFRGWEIGSILSVRSGLPFTPTMSGDPANTGQSSRPDRIGKGTLANPTIDKWFDASAFAVVPPGAYRYGNSGINILRGPGSFNLDFAVYKNFNFFEDRMRWQFRAEFFNLPNHPTFGLPFTDITVPSLVGKIFPGTAPCPSCSSSAGPPRIIQFGLKMNF